MTGSGDEGGFSLETLAHGGVISGGLGAMVEEVCGWPSLHAAGVQDRGVKVIRAEEAKQKAVLGQGFARVAPNLTTLGVCGSILGGGRPLVQSGFP